MFFTLFGLFWVLSPSVKLFLVGMVLSWAKNAEGLRRLPHYLFFGWFEMNKIELFFIMRRFWTKGWNTLLFENCGYELRVFIDEDLLSWINSIDWLGSKWGWVLFFVVLFFFSCAFLGDLCILPINFGCYFGAFFLYILFYFTYQIYMKDNSVYGICIFVTCERGP